MQNLDFGSMVKIEPLQVDDTEPLRAEIETFLHSVRNNAAQGDASPIATEPPSAAAASAEEGLAAVVMAERITEAVREQDWGGTLTDSVESTPS